MDETLQHDQWKNVPTNTTWIFDALIHSNFYLFSTEVTATALYSVSSPSGSKVQALPTVPKFPAGVKRP